MASSFDQYVNSLPSTRVFDDEELAIQLLAEELAFQSPSRNVASDELLHEVTQTPALDLQNDLELAKMLQAREDEQSMLASAAENSRTDLELAKILQMDVDEEMMDITTTEDKTSDLELAKMLQQQEEIAANDFLIAKQLQEELEQERPVRCDSCGQQGCQDHSCRTHRRRMVRHHFHGTDEEEDDEGDGDDDDYDDHSGAFHNFMFHHVFPPIFADASSSSSSEGDDYEELLEIGETLGEARPQGLDIEELNTLPTSRFTSQSQSQSTTLVKNDLDSNKCHICFCDFSNNDVLRTLPCLHRFHRDCIDQWIQRKADCPVCRVAIKDHIPGSSFH